MIRARAAGFLLWILLLCGGAQAAIVDDYAYAWPVQVQGTSAAWQVEITPEVYAAVTSADLRDVEVVGASGEPVPVAAFHPATATAPPGAFVELPQFALPLAPASTGAPADTDAIRLQIERGADGRLRRVDANVGTPSVAAAPVRDVLLDASGVHEPIATLRLDWTASGDATAQFAISGSDDLQQWRPLVASATVLHLIQGGNVLDRHEIALNGTRAQYLRLHRLDDGTPLPPFSARVRSAASTAERPALQWLTATSSGADVRRMDPLLPAGDGQRTVAFRYELPAMLTIEAIRVALVDDNSLAHVHVLSRRRAGDQLDAWQLRADFVAFRLHQGDAVISNDDYTAISGPRARDWRVEFATPVEHPPALSLAYHPDRFVFLAQGAGPYRLIAGSGRARRGDYPIDAALASLRASQGSNWQPPLATLGARTTLRGDAALIVAAPVVQRDWRTWILWAVLVGAAALVAGLALSLLRKG